MQEKTDGQIVQERWTECLPEMDKMTSSDGQNDPIVYKEKIKENNIKKDEEVTSSLSDSHNAHPERDLFSGLYSHVPRNKRRSLEEIEDSMCENITVPLDKTSFLC